MARSSGYQQAIMKGQSAPGVAATGGFSRVDALRMKASTQAEVQNIGSSGIKVPVAVVVNKEWSSLGVEIAPCFNGITAVLDSLFGPTVPTTPDAGNAPAARRRDYFAYARSADAHRLYTAWLGDEAEAERIIDLVFNTLGIDISRGAVSLSTSALGRAAEFLDTQMPGDETQTITITGSPTGGTFTLTFGGFTTAPITWTASAAVTQAALELLPSIGVGNVLVSGSSFPAQVQTVRFRNNLGKFDQPLMTATGSFTGGTAPAIVIAEAGKGVVDIPVVPMPGKNWDFYADDSWAGRHTSKLLAAYKGTYNHAERLAPDWTVNSANASFDSLVEVDGGSSGMAHTGNLLLGFDATSRALVTTFRAGAQKVISMSCSGPVIGGAVSYYFQIDFVIRITKPGERGGTDNVVTLPFDFVNSYDATSGNYLAVQLINTVPSAGI